MVGLARYVKLLTMSVTKPSPDLAVLPARPAPLHRVERVARLLDDSFRIPGTGIRVGLDSLIGLIPGVGDLFGVGLGSWFIYEAHRLGAPAALKWKMARNVVLDAVLGFVPVLGDILDVAYRSNRRNLELLRSHYQPHISPKIAASRRLWWLVLLFAVAALGLFVWRAH
jgi:hypothetical protein